MNRAVVLLALLGGCFDSIISDPCAAGFALQGGSCLARSDLDAGSDGHIDAHDAMVDSMIDAPAIDSMLVDAAPTDALVCTLPELDCDGVCLDVSSDPNNCGACGNVCASGVCAMSVCVGAVPGHIVAIGHDYQVFDGAMARVLGNSVALGLHQDVAVAKLPGTASMGSLTGSTVAMASGMAQVGRPFHVVEIPTQPSATALAGVDTLIVDAQLGDDVAAQSMGAAWKIAIDPLLARGGVVIVLEGKLGVSYRFASGAHLYTATAPADATGQSAVVIDGTDAVTQAVVSPYLAQPTSVTEFGAAHAVITTTAGAPLVWHLTR